LLLTDGSNGQRHDLLFASGLLSAGGQVGSGYWDDRDDKKELVLQVFQDMECNIEYIFSFTLGNPRDGQDPPEISIEAKRLHPGRELTKIVKTAMNPDRETTPTGGVKGDAEALKIRYPQFTVHTIVQSSSTPCDLNTIAVTLRSNVPLIAACKPRVTMTGLVGSDTASFPRQYKTEYTNCSIPNCNGTVAMIGSRPVPVQGCTYSFTKLDGIDQYDGLQGVLTGEDACVGHGWLEPQCRAVGCCLWNAGSGCQSAIGGAQCVLNSTCASNISTLEGLPIMVAALAPRSSPLQTGDRIWAR
jgi:hypothetical protein